MNEYGSRNILSLMLLLHICVVPVQNLKSQLVQRVTSIQSGCQSANEDDSETFHKLQRTISNRFTRKPCSSALFSYRLTSLFFCIRVYWVNLLNLRRFYVFQKSFWTRKAGPKTLL